MGRSDDPSAFLTPREKQVLELIRLGYSNRGIAEELSITVAGVRYHVSEILSKLDVSSREEAADWKPNGHRWGLGLLFSKPVGSFSQLLPKAVAGIGLLIIAFIALVVVPASNDKSSSQEGSEWKIAWINDGNVWTKDLPNGQSIQLAEDGDAWLPHWSPSGDWLAEGAVSGVSRVVKADGTTTGLPTQGGVWSPVDDVLAVPTGIGFRIETPQGAILHNVDLRPIFDARQIDIQLYPPYLEIDRQWVSPVSHGALTVGAWRAL